MFLYQLFFRLSREKRMPFYSANHRTANDHLVTPEIDHDFCFGPIRHFFMTDPDVGENVTLRRLFQVRDPRDILCSEYFSFGWNHTDSGFTQQATETREKIRSMPIDEFLLDPQGSAVRLERRLRCLPRSVKDRSVSIVQYEEMVSDFGSWLKKVVEVFDFRPLQKKLVLAKYRFKYRNEFKPDPNPNSHKRNVQAGEHREKLKPETIDRLNEIFAPYLGILGYGERAEEIAA